MKKEFIDDLLIEALMEAEKSLKFRIDSLNFNGASRGEDGENLTADLAIKAFRIHQAIKDFSSFKIYKNEVEKQIYKGEVGNE